MAIESQGPYISRIGLPMGTRSDMAQKQPGDAVKRDDLIVRYRDRQGCS